MSKQLIKRQESRRLFTIRLPKPSIDDCTRFDQCKIEDAEINLGLRVHLHNNRRGGACRLEIARKRAAAGAGAVLANGQHPEALDGRNGPVVHVDLGGPRAAALCRVLKGQLVVGTSDRAVDLLGKLPKRADIVEVELGTGKPVLAVGDPDDAANAGNVPTRKVRRQERIDEELEVRVADAAGRGTAMGNRRGGCDGGRSKANGHEAGTKIELHCEGCFVIKECIS